MAVWELKSVSTVPCVFFILIFCNLILMSQKAFITFSLAVLWQWLLAISGFELGVSLCLFPAMCQAASHLLPLMNRCILLEFPSPAVQCCRAHLISWSFIFYGQLGELPLCTSSQSSQSEEHLRSPTHSTVPRALIPGSIACFTTNRIASGMAC